MPEWWQEPSKNKKRQTKIEEFCKRTPPNL